MLGGHAGVGAEEHGDGIPMQTMPVAQSLCAWHVPGTHSLIVWGVQGGSVGHVAPGAQAMPGHPVLPTTSQSKPCWQSESAAQLCPALAVPGMSQRAPDTTRANDANGVR